MDRVRFAERIKGSDLRLDIIDDLTRRLSVASAEGCAHVVRDYEAAMVERRKQVLKSHARYHGGKSPSPRDKRMICLDLK
jgi:hypothetical protein